MSATLDAEPVSVLLDNAPLITSEGQSFEVDTFWLDRPVPKTQRFEQAMAALIERALREAEGSLLAFLPGEGEIRRVASSLNGLPPDVSVHPLYGALPFAAQRAAIAPVATGRKVVLATSIAETALTIEDVRIVVDGGKARRARFDPARGMSRLITERVTRAEAIQRRGRAGRVAAGACYRLWTRSEEGGMHPFPPPEIAAADLSGLVLELALWGVSDPDDLAFLTPPPFAAWGEAQGLLIQLGALDQHRRITDHGRHIARLPLHPRLAHMVTVAGPDAAPLAALLSERDPLRGVGCDLLLRLEALQNPARYPAARPALERIKAEAKRLSDFRRKSGVERGKALSPAEAVALAYPDRIGLRRKGDAPRWILSGGTGAEMDAGDALAGARLIVASDLDGDGREARIRQAIALSEAALRGLYADQIDWQDVCEWSKRERKVLSRQQERFGALVLEDRRWDDAPAEAVAVAMLDGVRDLGLPWSAAARRLQSRVEVLRAQGSDLPDFSDAGLMAMIENWLLPFLGGIKTAEALKGVDLVGPLRALLGWDGTEVLDRLAPGHFVTPLGRKVAIDYATGVPEISVRLQEMFGVTQHPVIGPERLPLKVTLLSPGQKPVQTTTDLPGFWASSYADVRKDMRGRYPRHPWPEDPTQADPTLRAKPRGT
jgi:ATP-dependent helicase HrpB